MASSAIQNLVDVLAKYSMVAMSATVMTEVKQWPMKLPISSLKKKLATNSYVSKPVDAHLPNRIIAVRDPTRKYKGCIVHYQPDAVGDWGREQTSETVNVSTEMFTMADASKIFLRSWQTESNAVLLILHGLGAHSGWFIDMGNELAMRGLNVYTMDHRGFGRSEGLAGHIDSYHLFVEDASAIIAELRKRHPLGRIYLLGHSMGGIFTAHIAAKHGGLLAGALFL